MLDLNRRNMLTRALFLVGAAAVPGIPEAVAAAAKSPQHQLDAPRYKLLIALADTIVPKTDSPGAVDVGTPKVVDALLGTWASPERRAAMIGSLDKIDSAAKAQTGKPFADLGLAERTAVLTPHDAAALQTPPPEAAPPPGSAKQAVPETLLDRSAPRYVDPGYGKLKELIVVGYYLTEAALTTELRYEHDPGAWEPSLPVTTDTRPWGGISLI